MEGRPHISVMLKEVLEYLQARDGELILDGTFGAGGYSRAILDSCNCSVIATDRDISVKTFTDSLKEKYGERFEFKNLKFSEVAESFEANSLDAIVLDLGISSMQVDEAERGFSFGKEANLDMRMGKNTIDAMEVVNSFKEEEIADIIYNYGDEVKSRVIAKQIVQARAIKPIKTTVELADLVRSCFKTRGKIDNATKTFQALRIYVNDELNELKSILNASKSLLKSGGRLVVVSFHSLEDKIVKDFMRENSEWGLGKVNKYREEEKSVFKLIGDKVVTVSSEEVKNNIRARSAKLRGVIKC